MDEKFEDMDTFGGLLDRLDEKAVGAKLNKVDEFFAKALGYLMSAANKFAVIDDNDRKKKV